ncbi:phosphoribosylamine--glycine ligase [Sandaracinobacter neustonicus]|uniref:Phosphoribosylamine--glycine ligase n=1 Tax=Sandaracinobacter neustonicus TaxID=1715348 RepID=A0A501XDG9_9SPHN|nr:phosphoribosylamine--glycine ligase [Sandaracinobacter neustonicus]TPE58668.1 phosphoribosylamine--glycine ligase [Sandaracinobacter neustonicus]
MSISTAFPILLLGSGGREHALALKLAASPLCARLFVAPGNPGMAGVATPLPALDILDPAAVTAFARAERIGLVVIGPEAPLAAGVADALRAAQIPVFGPSADAARLEASKAFTKQLCDDAQIPTARYRRFDALEPALAYAAAHPLPVVVKADGLAAGKGVTVAATHAEAESALRDLFVSPGAEVVIEQCLVGEEVSFFVLADGTTALPLLAAQDHKRVGDGDTGPNTGGMGAYAPARVFTAELQARTMAEIIEPTLATMAARGTPFTGVLFAGLMLTDSGPSLIEYNVRFGDPECQVLMALLDSDLADLLLAAANGELAGHTARWKPAAAAVIVVAAKGYPGTPAKGGPIGNLEAAEATGARVLHAGTALDAQGQLISSGGRVLGVTASGPTVAQAVATAYAAVEKISFADGFFRRDIGWREIARERADG